MVFLLLGGGGGGGELYYYGEGLALWGGGGKLPLCPPPWINPWECVCTCTKLAIEVCRLVGTNL